MIAIRGAIQIDRDDAASIAAAVEAMCAALIADNALSVDEIVSAFFTLTPDLRADFPAKAARGQGWGEVPMICAQEIGVPGAMPRVCRVLLHVDRPRATSAPVHVYLGGAQALRPDLARR